ncbi:hypothetical protein [Amycolatopsis sp. cmx-4-61]|uniref:hypothetical protein n=1 Tax=Amycolatopsis sp. cmx-4-61 TaxID=2790937 RepID=UPI00397D4042
MPKQRTPDEHGAVDDGAIEEAAAQAVAEVLGGPLDDPEDVPLLDESMLPEVVTDLVATSDKQGVQLGVLATRVESLDEALQALEESLIERVNLARPSRWAWEFLTQDETAQLWRETRWFVDYLTRRYPLVSEVSIPPCWYRHTVAVDELSDLYAAWREAYCSSSRPSTAMTAWRDRWLWPALNRLATYANWRECKETRRHVEPSARQDLTDDEFDRFVQADIANRPGARAQVMPWPTRKPAGKKGSARGGTASARADAQPAE